MAARKRIGEELGASRSVPVHVGHGSLGMMHMQHQVAQLAPGRQVTCAICKNPPVSPIMFRIRLQVEEYELPDDDLGADPNTCGCRPTLSKGVEHFWVCVKCILAPVSLVVATCDREGGKNSMLDTSHYTSEVLLAENPGIKALDAMHSALEQNGFKRGK